MAVVVGAAVGEVVQAAQGVAACSTVALGAYPAEADGARTLLTGAGPTWVGSLGRVVAAAKVVGDSQREVAEGSAEEDELVGAAWAWGVWEGAALVAHHRLRLLRACAAG
jgi:hypothetical protein